MCSHSFVTVSDLFVRLYMGSFFLSHSQWLSLVLILVFPISCLTALWVPLPNGHLTHAFLLLVGLSVQLFLSFLSHFFVLICPRSFVRGSSCACLSFPIGRIGGGKACTGTASRRSEFSDVSSKCSNRRRLFCTCDTWRQKVTKNQLFFFILSTWHCLWLP